jgi:ceramide glucosyltransferase
VVLAGAVLPGLYYVAVLIAGHRFFSRSKSQAGDFTPPVTLLKPVRGLDPEAYENFASFCRQDYPEYEILFGVASEQDPAVPTIWKVVADFPDLSIRLLVTESRRGSNDKVSKLCGLQGESRFDILITSDSDVRVGPEYLRSVVAPFRDTRVSAATTLYTGIAPHGLWSRLEAINLSSDFMPAVLVAKLIEGVRFTLGATMAVRRDCLSEVGGFEALADSAADDHDLGRRLWERGHRVELVDAGVETVCSSGNWRSFFGHHLRWAIMNRHSRPWGYFGYVVTLGLPWALVAAILAPTRRIALGYLAGYVIMRTAVAMKVAVEGLRDPLPKRNWWLIPLWDACAAVVWFISLFWNRIRWQGIDYLVMDGRLVPAQTKDP